MFQVHTYITLLKLRMSVTMSLLRLLHIEFCLISPQAAVVGLDMTSLRDNV